MQLAQQAVNCAPSEFVTWAKLTECYIELGQYESALLTLNSCPMFTYNDRDLHRMPTPNRTHLPVKQFIADSQILDGDGVEEDTDPALLRLPAPALRGTFAKAYALLCRLVGDIGWDELLKTRSAVFVMEEEYRNQKTQHAEESAQVGVRTNGVIYEDGSVRDSLATTGQTVVDPDADEDASTRGMASPPPDTTEVEDTVPSNRLSDESARTDDKEEEEEDAPVTAQAESVNGNGQQGFGAASSINKPRKAAASEVDETEDDERKRELRGSGDPLSLTSKRLCERWLDNMFMCLYEVRIHHL